MTDFTSKRGDYHQAERNEYMLGLCDGNHKLNKHMNFILHNTQTNHPKRQDPQSMTTRFFIDVITGKVNPLTRVKLCKLEMLDNHKNIDSGKSPIFFWLILIGICLL